MKSWQQGFLLGCLALFSSACSSNKSPQEIAQLLDDSVVLINYASQGGHGTGFFVPGESDDCHVLTVRHVVDVEDSVKLTTSDDKTRSPKSIRLFKNQDLALLTFAPESKSCSYPALSLGNSDLVQRAQTIHISGFYNNGNQILNHYVNGSVTATGNLPYGYGISYQSSVFKGMSGSPVLSQAGKVVAVHGLSNTDIARLQDIPEIDQSDLQALEEQAAQEQGARFNTYRWGIPINLYLANIPNPDNLLQQGNSLLSSEKYSEAVGIYDEVISISPNLTPAWASKAEAQWKLKQYDEALASYDKAIELDPNYVNAWYNRGNSLRKIERYEDALASYNKAIELDPNYVNAWYNRGYSLGELGKYKDAFASYDKAIKLDPNYVNAWYNHGYSLGELGKYEDALASYDKVIELNPDYAHAWNNRGISLDKLGRDEDALASYDKAIELDPDYETAINNRELLLKKMNR